MLAALTELRRLTPAAVELLSRAIKGGSVRAAEAVLDRGGVPRVTHAAVELNLPPPKLFVLENHAPPAAGSRRIEQVEEPAPPLALEQHVERPPEAEPAIELRDPEPAEQPARELEAAGFRCPRCGAKPPTLLVWRMAGSDDKVSVLCDPNDDPPGCGGQGIVPLDVLRGPPPGGSLVAGRGIR